MLDGAGWMSGYDVVSYFGQVGIGIIVEGGGGGWSGAGVGG